jgi:ABC-type polysaccharide/polyol phosphate export permease
VAIGIQSLIELAIMCAILAVIGNVGLSWMLIPLWIVLLLVFVASGTYVLAVLNVFFRDVAQIVAVALQMIFFLTPIIYPLTLIPEQWNGIPIRALIELSPITQFVGFGRSLLYDLQVPQLGSILGVVAWTALALLLARFVASRAGQDVSEFI